MTTPRSQILKLLKQWSPDVTHLLDQAGYFDLEEGIAKSQIEKAIGLNRGGRLYRQVLAASLEKNNKIWPMVINEYSLREFKSGAREVAKSLNIPFSPWDWNAAAQDYFEKDGLKKVKTLTQTDIDSLRTRVQYDFGMNPKTFAEKYAETYSCSEARLERIKRTETHSAAQAGGQEFALGADCQFKQWMCSEIDQWPRPSHREIWYEIQPIDQPFSNGQDWPQDPNCRCYLLYYIDQDHVDQSAKGPGD
jgi:hypothetical protein